MLECLQNFFIFDKNGGVTGLPFYIKMEDIEDLLVGDGGVAPGFRLPVTSVGLNPKKKSIKSNKQYLVQDPLQSVKIPGTQVLFLLFSHVLSFNFYEFSFS